MGEGAFYLSAAEISGSIDVPLFDRCVAEVESRGFAYDHVVRAYLSGLIIAVYRLLDAKLPADDKGRAAGTPSVFDSILEYIDDHSGEKLLVEELAAGCGMSYSSFAKKFKEEYGRSCREYIEYIRIIKADELLCGGRMDLSGIAQETGFADCSHFIRTYRKLRGTTPGKARKKDMALG